MVTYPRVEIPKKVKLAVFERAGGLTDLRCEGKCKLPVKRGNFEYHHDFPEWLQQIPPSQRDPITPDDVLLLCKSCHGEISGRDTTARAHGQRIVEKTAKVAKPKHGGFSKRYKQKMNGTIINRETGEIIKRGRNG